jgi:hypothetical protein
MMGEVTLIIWQISSCAGGRGGQHNERGGHTDFLGDKVSAIENAQFRKNMLFFKYAEIHDSAKNRFVPGNCYKAKTDTS